MAAFVVTFVVVIGINTMLWVSAGIVRVVAARLRGSPVRASGRVPTPEDVAVVIAAHNEELVIEATIRSAARQVPIDNVFVVSDGSRDATAAVASAHGATVLDLSPNRGKAGAIRAIVEEFDIAGRFEVLLLLDADSQLSDDYLVTGLRDFADPEVVAVAGRATTLLHPVPPTVLGRLLVAYRERLYLSVQYLQKFGQAARHLNAVSIVPGFASMYRTRVLAHIDIDAPGLTIEDYNMTFEVHAKRLGRIAFRPDAAVALTQDPDNLRDYSKQMRRWSLGFWQTVRRHGVHAGRFWTLLAISITELVTSSVVTLLAAPIALLSVGAAIVAASGADPSGTAAAIAGALPPLAIVAGVLLPDYLLSVLAAVLAKRPSYLVRGLVFPVLRMLDALLCLQAMRDAFVRRTDGRWASPERRAVAQAG
ncbi:glycosyltransferase family 2 protein [Protaetiibacter larvae]|uniref:Glycosyltransferase family 2 protein n=1 Tax=Protaetiibacter larvae TaxID=2592654 RepID=A0A5C1Y7Q7_9MICO|nr:glycosyltransferase family 2 protein [Protaetiibacter larvae]QEO09438.1 glycosyltransferase family 2 protein [Protaetiibacter larvae]